MQLFVKLSVFRVVESHAERLYTLLYLGVILFFFEIELVFLLVLFQLFLDLLLVNLEPLVDFVRFVLAQWQVTLDLLEFAPPATQAP